MPARRTLHLRFNNLQEPAPIPRDIHYSTLFESDVPIVCNTPASTRARQNSRSFSTIAFGQD